MYIKYYLYDLIINTMNLWIIISCLTQSVIAKFGAKQLTFFRRNCETLRVALSPRVAPLPCRVQKLHKMRALCRSIRPKKNDFACNQPEFQHGEHDARSRIGKAFMFCLSTDIFCPKFDSLPQHKHFGSNLMCFQQVRLPGDGVS